MKPELEFDLPGDLWRKYGLSVDPEGATREVHEHCMVALMLESRPALQKSYFKKDLRYDDVLDLVEAAAKLQ